MGAGHQVWWDRHIRSGAEFAGAIEEALNSADEYRSTREYRELDARFKRKAAHSKWG